MFNLQLRAAVLNEKNCLKVASPWVEAPHLSCLQSGQGYGKFAGILRQTRYAQSLLIIFVKGNTVDTISSSGKHVTWFHAAHAIQTTSLNYIVRHVPNYQITMPNIHLPLTVTLQITSRCFIINQEHPTANYVSKYYVRSVSNGFLYALAACYVSQLIWRLLP